MIIAVNWTGVYMVDEQEQVGQRMTRGGRRGGGVLQEEERQEKEQEQKQEIR